jgi:hypothetical protein
MKRFTAGLTAAATLLVACGPSFAGGRGVACYEPVRTGPVYETVTERVLVRPETVVYDVEPAQYGTRARQVVVQPQRTELYDVPAVFGAQQREVVLAPGRTVRRHAAPRYAEVTEKVQVQAARVAWEWRIIDGKRVKCRVEYPARYEHRTRKVLVEPGGSWTEYQPEQRATVTSQVLVQRPGVRAQTVLPQIDWVEERYLVRPEVRIPRLVPAVYETRTRRVLVKAHGEGLRRIHVGKTC